VHIVTLGRGDVPSFAELDDVDLLVAGGAHVVGRQVQLMSVALRLMVFANKG